MRIVNNNVLDEFRYLARCEWCGQGLRGLKTHPHHVHSRGAGQLDIRINLVGLCPAFRNNCHGLAHDGHILRCDLLAVVAAREGVMQDKIEEIVWELRRWPKEKTLPPRLRRWLGVSAAWPFSGYMVS